MVQYSNHKPLPEELRINLPPGLLEDACKEYNISLTKSQLKEIEQEATKKFKAYCERCKKEGNYDRTTGYPLPDPE